MGKVRAAFSGLNLSIFIDVLLNPITATHKPSTSTNYQHAETNHGNQRLPVEGQEEGRQVGADQKTLTTPSSRCVVPGTCTPLLSPTRKRPKTEAVFAPRSPGQRTQVNLS